MHLWVENHKTTCYHISPRGREKEIMCSQLQFEEIQTNSTHSVGELGIVFLADLSHSTYVLSIQIHIQLWKDFLLLPTWRSLIKHWSDIEHDHVSMFSLLHIRVHKFSVLLEVAV